MRILKFILLSSLLLLSIDCLRFRIQYSQYRIFNPFQTNQNQKSFQRAQSLQKVQNSQNSQDNRFQSFFNSQKTQRTQSFGMGQTQQREQQPLNTDNSQRIKLSQISQKNQEPQFSLRTQEPGQKNQNSKISKRNQILQNLKYGNYQLSQFSSPMQRYIVGRVPFKFNQDKISFQGCNKNIGHYQITDDGIFQIKNWLQTKKFCNYDFDHVIRSALEQKQIEIQENKMIFTDPNNNPTSITSFMILDRQN